MDDASHYQRKSMKKWLIVIVMALVVAGIITLILLIT
jgi:hypothetical protein